MECFYLFSIICGQRVDGIEQLRTALEKKMAEGEGF